ncbi:cytokine-dependent hematopoietic cell linker isoform X2 [Salarias fasciatus]|uniref:cytokine-dependent hematopoietic cell linker isoform X2 n=1 Tax=Salarias fasciatus TaxID=181472 RepID=UPI001176FFEC|nr:cytokine-dependent hematopoietic cell linker isoform X2 [Salarias fasciatus]
MDRRTRRYGNRCSSDYDVVDDQEEALGVHILPAKPINHEGEYADRDPLQSPQLHVPPAVRSTLTDVSAPHPRRETLQSAAPPIRRHLKPNRRKTRYKKAPAVPADEEEEERFPDPDFKEIISRFQGLDLHEGCSRDTRQRTAKKKAPSYPSGSQSAERDGMSPAVQRYSFDLESQDTEKRFTENLEKMLSRRLSHEWPQTKEDQHDFVPMEKPEETFSEEDWYVGACDRADAEHALHLVNKDGAFLVRDCSVNTDSEPLVLVVYHEKKVYNVKIRFIEGINKFALGTGQRSNDMFQSVADIIKFHSIFPIILVSGRSLTGSRYPENCVLTCPVTRRDVQQLLQ